MGLIKRVLFVILGSMSGLLYMGYYSANKYDLHRQRKYAHSKNPTIRSAYSADLLRMIPEVEPLPVDCRRIFSGDPEEIRKAANISYVQYIPDADFVQMTKDCDAFKRQRRYLTKPVNEEEEGFQIAYSIQMYKDVVQMERLLRAIYRPQNTYCINVDKSSGPDVHRGMEALSACFSNIVLSNVNVHWASFSQVQADLTCMELLYNKSTTWKYLLTLTGQEFPLKTNLDLVKILKALNGSQDMIANTKKSNSRRWEKAGPPPINATMLKGSCHFAVTRGFVKYAVFDKEAKKYFQWGRKTHFPDEHMFQSLGHSPQLGIPGVYTGNLAESRYTPISRYKKWRDHKKHCSGRYVRQVCVYGIGDLAAMSNTYHMFANKFYYNLQPMTLGCLEQRHYNWTWQDVIGNRAEDRLNMTFYHNLPNVKQHVPSGLEH